MHLPRMRNQPHTDGGLTPDEDGIVHTGSISSTVDLDFKHGEAHKVYHPSAPVRLLYRLAFQARFPYVANHPALEAARLRRRVVDILTKYWFGHHLVARVLDVGDVPGGAHDFVTELVKGHEPEDKERAKAFLKDLDRRFMDSGIATWQITPYNPHSITNLIEKDDGTYRIIDLESSLVAFLYPLSRLVGFVRAGLVPSFDDIDMDRLDAYLTEHNDSLRAGLGVEHDELIATCVRVPSGAGCVAQVGATGRQPHAALRAAPRGRAVMGTGRQAADDARRAPGARPGPGRAGAVGPGGQDFTRKKPASLLATLNTPDVERAFVHLGAHFAISLPLRFPLGATSRFIYTVGLRLRAEMLGLLRRSDPKPARRLHTAPVALFALIPGFGRLAYMLSPALASQPLLAAIPLDHVARKLPFHLYPRLHLEALFVYWGRSQALAPPRLHSLARLPAAIAARHRQLRPYLGLIAVVIAVNLGALLAGTALYLQAGSPEPFWWFDEFGPMQGAEAVQLSWPASRASAAYVAFWRRSEQPAADAFGIFLWAIGGAGLIAFAVDDFFGLHEWAGKAFGGIGFLPQVTDVPDDVLILTYVIAGLALLAIFKNEVLSTRNSTALLIPATVFSVLMVFADVFGEVTGLRP